MSTETKNNTPNWWDEDYLAYKLIGPWVKKWPGSIDTVKPELLDLANKIIQSKRYSLISDYFIFGTKWSDKVFENGGKSNNTITIEYRGKTYPLSYMFHEILVRCCIVLLDELSSFKGKILIGVDHKIPLWMDIPYSWIDKEGYWGYELSFGLVHLHLLPILSGESRQQFYDKLILPPINKWPSISHWSFSKLLNYEKTIGIHLGFPEGFVTEDEYVQILSQAFLEQKYILIENRPVLVRLQEHPSIREIILVKKENKLIARICTFEFGDFLHIQFLTEIYRIDQLGVFKSILAKQSKINFTEDEFNWSITALIASVYRDLVTVEEKEISSRRVAGKKKPDLKTKRLDPLEPKLFTTSWQYIPRRQYIYNRPDDSSYMDREPLPEADQHKQRAIRKWHMVCGHIRRYRDKPDWMANGDKQDQALADGVILRTGETYVRPHARNAGALEELGDIDINSIPHYMRRKMAS